jgi:hypothetical protein
MTFGHPSGQKRRLGEKRGNVNQVPLVIAVLAWLCPSLMAGYRLARIALKSI